jgi:hypothetical protein
MSFRPPDGSRLLLCADGEADPDDGDPDDGDPDDGDLLVVDTRT